MKKILTLLLFSFLLFSCSESTETQPEQKKFDLVLKFNGGVKSPLDIENPITYSAATNEKRPIELGYWECANNVYTDGYNTYTYTIYNDVGTAPQGATWVWDDFSQTMYAYTTQWGGTCN